MEKMTYQEAADLFGLSLETLTERGLKGAYRKLVKKYHPDRNNTPNAAEKMKKINVAKELLDEYILKYGEGKPETSIVNIQNTDIQTTPQENQDDLHEKKKKRAKKRAKKVNKPKVLFTFPRIFPRDPLTWGFIISLSILTGVIIWSVCDSIKFEREMEEQDRQFKQRMKARQERVAHEKHVQDSLRAIYPDYKFDDTLYVTSARLIKDEYSTYVVAELMDENGNVIHMSDGNRNGTVFHAQPGSCVVRKGTRTTIPGQEKTQYGTPYKRLTPLESELWARSHGIVK